MPKKVHQAYPVVYSFANLLEKKNIQNLLGPYAAMPYRRYNTTLTYPQRRAALRALRRASRPYRRSRYRRRGRPRFRRRYRRRPGLSLGSRRRRYLLSGMRSQSSQQNFIIDNLYQIHNNIIGPFNFQINCWAMKPADAVSFSHANALPAYWNDRVASKYNRFFVRAVKVKVVLTPYRATIGASPTQEELLILGKFQREPATSLSVTHDERSVAHSDPTIKYKSCGHYYHQAAAETFMDLKQSNRRVWAIGGYMSASKLLKFDSANLHDFSWQHADLTTTRTPDTDHQWFFNCSVQCYSNTLRLVDTGATMEHDIDVYVRYYITAFDSAMDDNAI